MSRNILVVAGLALILAVGALVLQFVLPSDGGVGSSDLDAIQADITQLKQASASQSMKLAYMDAEDAAVYALAINGAKVACLSRRLQNQKAGSPVSLPEKLSNTS